MKTKKYLGNPTSSRTAGILLAGHLAGCSIPGLMGRELTKDESKEVWELIHQEEVQRGIVRELAKNSEMEMTDLWGGTVVSNEEAMMALDEEIGGHLKEMMRDGEIRAFSGEDFLGGKKDHARAFFMDTPIARNPDDGHIFLNVDMRTSWTASLLAHEVSHSCFGDHSAEIKKYGRDDEVSTIEMIHYAVEDADIPYELGYLYVIAQKAVETDEDKQVELFLEINWHNAPNGIFKELERVENEDQSEWAEKIAELTYPKIKGQLKALGVDKDGLERSLASSSSAWVAHKELLVEIRLEVEAEYLAEAQAELEEQERQQEAREEIIQKGAESMKEISGPVYEEEKKDGYRFNNR